MGKSKVSISLLKAVLYGVCFGMVYGFIIGGLDDFFVTFAIGFFIFTSLAFLALFFQRPPGRYKISLNTDKKSISGQKNIFKMSLSKQNSAGLIIFPILVFFYSASDSYSRIHPFIAKEAFLKAGVVIIIEMLFALKIFLTRLEISPENIQYQTLGYRINVKWEELEAIEMGKQGQIVMLFKDSEFKGWDFFKGLRVIFESENRIPLHHFSKNWRESELGDILRHYLKGIEI